MTKQHFIALADTIIASGQGAFSDSAINALADFCAAQNPTLKKGNK